jgi:CDP-6-deoxy-D-xylo-4-hexulose-3-dehydrase
MINYAEKWFDHIEREYLKDAARELWLTHGKWCNRFEQKLSEFTGVKKALLVNSGSSANLLAFMTLTQPELKERQIMRGDEVITTACCFPTTIAPIIQYGAVPVFIDVRIPEYNIDVMQLKKALSKKTKAIMVAHTLGRPCDIDALIKFCSDHGLWLILDSCDALGATYRRLQLPRFGDISTLSFYPAHHITTGEGGAVLTNNPELSRIASSLRDWGRACTCQSGQDNACGNRFKSGYDHKYVYSHFGYNLKATEFQGALGCAQIGKLPEIVRKRRQNWLYFRKRLDSLKDKMILPEQDYCSEHSPFGFLITLKSGRNCDLQKFLESKNIQSRPLFAGNILRQPCFKDIRHRKLQELVNTDIIHERSLWFGVHPLMTGLQRERIITALFEYFG